MDRFSLVNENKQQNIIHPSGYGFHERPRMLEKSFQVHDVRKMKGKSLLMNIFVFWLLVWKLSEKVIYLIWIWQTKGLSKKNSTWWWTS